MEGTFDVLVSLGLFRNVDLYRQGLYALRLALYTIEEGHAASAAAPGLLRAFTQVGTRNHAVLALPIPVATSAIPYRIVTAAPYSPTGDYVTAQQARSLFPRI
jgi:hypothetical protein